MLADCMELQLSFGTLIAPSNVVLVAAKKHFLRGSGGESNFASAKNTKIFCRGYRIIEDRERKSGL